MYYRRQRDYNPGVSPYNVLMETAKVDNSKISVEIINTKTQVRLRVEVSAVEGNIARLRIVEAAEDAKPRYEIPIGDCLVEEPKLARWVWTIIYNNLQRRYSNVELQINFKDLFKDASQ